jgi:hypothetical protein
MHGEWPLRHGRGRGDAQQSEPVEATNWKCDKPANETTLSKKDPTVMTGETKTWKKRGKFSVLSMAPVDTK